MSNFLDSYGFAALALGLLVWAFHASRGGRRRRATEARLGPYVLLDELGRGGMAKVYRGRHLCSGRWFAVKVLSPAAGGRARQRFEREALLTSRLRHPNTVTVYEHGLGRDGSPYYAMELITGVNLQELVAHEGPLPPERVIGILLQLCAALEAVHASGLVHRDVKPENILVSRGSRSGEQDRVTLLDFGLVKQVGVGSESDPVASSAVGTPLYMSPEAISAPHTVDARSDIYSVGAVGYFLLSGAPVFGGRNVLEVCSHHLSSPPAPLFYGAANARAAELERLVLECLAKQAGSRPASAAALAFRLQTCLLSAQPALRGGANASPRPGGGAAGPTPASLACEGWGHRPGAVETLGAVP